MYSARAARNRSPGGQRRRLAFRVGAVLLSLVPFVLVELFLWAGGWGTPSDHGDPFAGFRTITPLFVRSDDGARYETARGRQRFFRPDSFAAHKEAEEFRIFCLGGSTVQGRPFSIETAFSTWLELSLGAADPTRRFEVVNCGGISYASYRLVPILKEVLEHFPDLIVIYCGHNEFLEDRTYDHIKHMPEILATPLELCSRLRTFVVLREWLLTLTDQTPSPEQPSRSLLATEVDARLDHQGGLGQYRRDEKWRRDVLAHFEHSMRRMVRLCRDAGVPLILANPASNLRDCPPFKSEHRAGLSEADRKAWELRMQQARSQYGTNKHVAAQHLREAIEIDGEYATTHFELGKCLDAMGSFDEARKSYRRARELDVCPLRILEPMNNALIALASATRTPIVDVQQTFEKLSEDGIPGKYWIIDHVHPSIPGHQKIADALAGTIFEMGLVPPVADWAARKTKRFETHFASLDALYFEQGVYRLETVNSWARGQSKDP